jgi:hypothetical protein
MKIMAIIAAVFLAVISAQAAEARETPRRRVTVCTEYSSDPLRERAEMLANQIFAQAGVAIDWRALHSCPGDGLKIAFTTRTPEDRSPYDLAYARPFEGSTSRSSTTGFERELLQPIGCWPTCWSMRSHTCCRGSTTTPSAGS